MELLIEWLSLLGAFGLDSPFLRLLLVLVVVAVPSVGDANGHVELGDLVSVLARSWNFDGTCPVEVEVAKREGELLNLDFGELGLVLGHIEVSGQDAALSGCRWSHVEVERLLGLLIIALLDD